MSVTAKSGHQSVSQYLDESCAQTIKLFIRYRACLFKLVELSKLVDNTQADHTAQFIPRLLSVALGHPPSLGNQAKMPR